MHRRDRQSPVKVSKDFPNKYSVALLKCGKELSEEDFSSLKLLLQLNELVTVKDLEKVNNSIELISFLDKRSFISDKDLEFLRRCFMAIGRMDLIIKYIDTCTYTNSCTARSNTLPLLNWQPSSAHGSASGSQENITELKEGTDGATAAVSMMEDEDSDVIQSSQDSLTDDDKLALFD